MIELGSYVQDVITNFSGRAIGRCDYLTGCTQYFVQPPVKDSGEFVSGQWLDADRLSVKPDRELLTLPAQTANGADFAPPRL